MVLKRSHTFSEDDCREFPFFSCDSCKCSISTADRIVCMDCRSSDGWRTIDFCPKPSCYNKQVILGRRDLLVEHNTEHNLLLLKQVPHSILFFLSFNLRGDHNIYDRAMEKIRQTRRMFDPAVRDQSADGQENAPRCLSCSGVIPRLPCWACVPMPGKLAFLLQKLR